MTRGSFTGGNVRPRVGVRRREAREIAGAKGGRPPASAKGGRPPAGARRRNSTGARSAGIRQSQGREAARRREAPELHCCILMLLWLNMLCISNYEYSLKFLY